MAENVTGDITFFERVKKKYEENRIVVFGIIMLTILGGAVKFCEDINYIKERFKAKTQFRNDNPKSTKPKEIGNKNGIAPFYVQFEDIKVHIEINDSNKVESDATCMYKEIAIVGGGILKSCLQSYHTYDRSIKIKDDLIEIEYMEAIGNTPPCRLSFIGKKEGDKINGKLIWIRNESLARSEVNFHIEQPITLFGY